MGEQLIAGGKALSVKDLPAKLRLMAVAGDRVALSLSPAMARDVARAIETGLTATEDQQRILARAAHFRAQSLGAAREVLARAEAAHAATTTCHDAADRMLVEAKGRLSAALWMFGISLVVCGSLLAVMAGL
jgi:hypothetical protein